MKFGLVWFLTPHYQTKLWGLEDKKTKNNSMKFGISV